MKIIYILFLGLLSVGCKKERISVENLNGNKIGIIGHGGGGFGLISNPHEKDSYSSIVRGISGFHADGAELDCQLSSDGVIFLFHDQLLEQSTNYAGCLYQYDSTSLSSCEFRKNSSFSKEYLTTLEKIFSIYTISNPKPYMFLDVRTEVICPSTVVNQLAYEDSIAKEILEVVLRYDYLENVFVESANWLFLEKMKLLNPSVRLLYDGKIDLPTIQAAIAANIYGLVGINDETTKEQVSIAHQNNLRVVLFDAKSSQSQKETVSKWPDFIQTDRIILLQRILD